MAIFFILLPGSFLWMRAFCDRNATLQNPFLAAEPGIVGIHHYTNGQLAITYRYPLIAVYDLLCRRLLHSAPDETWVDGDLFCGWEKSGKRTQQ